MAENGIGFVGGGYMGKAHSVEMAAEGAVIDTPLRPRFEKICTSSKGASEPYPNSLGFACATTDWHTLVTGTNVEAVVIATPQKLHRENAEDVLADPALPKTWRTDGMANGCTGNLAPHLFPKALALLVPIERVMSKSNRSTKTDPAGQSQTRSGPNDVPLQERRSAKHRPDCEGQRHCQSCRLPQFQRTESFLQSR